MRPGRASLPVLGAAAAAFLTVSAFAAPKLTNDGDFSTGRKPPAVVAIDPGHGGEDRGAVVRGGVESEIVLGIAKRVAMYLGREKDLSAFLTRWTDDFVLLSERVLKSEAVGAKVFVSIHADKVYRRRGKGVVLYVYGKNPKIPDGPPRRSADKRLPPPPKSGIAASQRLAEFLLDGLNEEKVRAAHYVDRGAFAVLKSSVMPSVLVEVGNLRDPKESKQMTRSKFQKRIGRGLALGIRRFLDAQRRQAESERLESADGH